MATCFVDGLYPSVTFGMSKGSHLLRLATISLQAAGVDILTFGQYLQPTPLHLEVTEYVTPEKFEYWRRYGEDFIGFRCSRETLHTAEQHKYELAGQSEALLCILCSSAVHTCLDGALQVCSFRPVGPQLL